MPKVPYEPFVLFGRSHLIAIALTLCVPLVLALLVRTTKSEALAKTIRYAFVLAFMGAWASWFVVGSRVGWLDLGNVLPMDLCSWAAIATAIALIRPGQKSFDLAYFWALAATTQGLARPGLDYDFPEFRFVEFMLFHCGIIGAVLFLVLGQKMRPVAASIPRVAVWSLVYMAAAGLTDWVFKADYGFLRSKPIYPGLMNLMPDWPWYLPVLAALGFVSILVLYAPFFVIDLFKKRAPAA